MNPLLLVSGGSPGAPSAPGAYPDTVDPVLLALRPHGRTVGSSVVRSGTVSAGIDAAKALQTADAQTGSLGWDGLGPDYRADVFLRPGTHNESMGDGAWVNLVGTTGDPEDVVIWAEGDGSGGTLHTFGSAYIEGITLAARSRASDGYSPKYPWHITGGEMSVAAHCIFDTLLSTSGPAGHGTAGLAGMDGSSGATVVFYRCTFNAGEADGFNLHGTADGSPTTDPITWIFAECTFNDVAVVSAGGGAVTGGAKNRLYVVGCTGVTAIASTDQTDVYTDSSAPVTGAASTTRSVTTWPIPVDGLSALWNSYFYPSHVGTASRYVATVTDAAPFTPPAGRLYVTKVKPPYAMRSRKALVIGATSGGQYKVAQTPLDTAYDRNLPPDPTFGLTADQPFVAGDNALANYYWQTRYPGDNGWWVYSKFDGAASVSGSAQLGVGSFYSDNGVSWTAVGAGGRVPIVGLVDLPPA